MTTAERLLATCQGHPEQVRRMAAARAECADTEDPNFERFYFSDASSVVYAFDRYEHAFTVEAWEPDTRAMISASYL